MLDILDIRREESYFQQNKDVILYHSVTWTNVADKLLQLDGSFSDGSDTDTTIQAIIEPIAIKNQEQLLSIQGLAEKTTHFMFTLKNYDISEQDKITFDGKIYRIVYAFPEQYDIDFSEYLLAVED